MSAKNRHLSTLPADWELRAPDWPREKAAITDFAAKIFARPYHAWRWIGDSYFTDPAYDPAASRIGLSGGRVIAHWGVWNHRMRVGRGRWRVAGIGCVSCDPSFRKRGLLSLAARASMETYRAAGYDATMLAGIDNFYHRFGYVSAFDETTFTVRPDRLPPPAARPPERLGEDRRAEIDRLYNRWHDRATGTVVRPFLPGRFPGAANPEERAGGKDGFYGWSAAKGGRTALSGYFSATWDAGEARMTVSETAGPAPEALAAVSALAAGWGAREACFETIPARGPLALLLRAGVCRETVEHYPVGRAMIAAVSLAGMLRNLLPELEERRRQSPWVSAWRGVLRLEGDGQAESLRFGEKGIRLEEEGPAAGRRGPHRVTGGLHLPQLLLGESDPAELAARRTVRFAGDAARLAECLFPATHPAWARLDYY